MSDVRRTEVERTNDEKFSGSARTSRGKELSSQLVVNPRSWEQLIERRLRYSMTVFVYGLDQHFTWIDLTRTAGPRPP